MLISETDLTPKNNFHIDGYCLYDSKLPGLSITFKKIAAKTTPKQLQSEREITIIAIYSPPKFKPIF